MVTRLRRFSQIVEILGKYGFGIAVEELFPGQSRVRVPIHGSPPEQSTVYERMRLAIEELGPAFVKFGQIMSTRTELLPPEMIDELKKLQDHVKPVPFSEVRPVIEKSCPDPHGVFSSIDEVPVASASIAQVHRAVLRDGTNVALKIQRPGIPEIIETDLLILQSMAERIEFAFPETRVYNPTGMVRDFAQQIRKELDFLREASIAGKMSHNFRDVAGIHFPKIYREYSTSRLLVMEYVEGVRIDDVEALSAQGLDLHELGARGFHAYLKMIFEDGFFHGDPHPGNLLVAKDGTIVVLDFGIVGILRPERRRYFISFLFALVHEDTDLMMQSLEGFGIVIPENNREPLRDDLFILVQDLGIGYTISQFNLPVFVTELSGVMRRYRIAVPANLMLLLKVLVMILDIGIRLDPSFGIQKELTPYLSQLADKRMILSAYAQRASASFLDAGDAVLDMPRHLNLTVRLLSTGTIHLNIAEMNLRKFQMALDSASDKLMIGLVVGSLAVGSSLVMMAAPLAVLPEVSWIAVLGYSAAVLVGFYAVYHIAFLKVRQGR